MPKRKTGNLWNLKPSFYCSSQTFYSIWNLKFPTNLRWIVNCVTCTRMLCIHRNVFQRWNLLWYLVTIQRSGEPTKESMKLICLPPSSPQTSDKSSSLQKWWKGNIYFLYATYFNEVFNLQTVHWELFSPLNVRDPVKAAKDSVSLASPAPWLALSPVLSHPWVPHVVTEPS